MGDGMGLWACPKCGAVFPSKTKRNEHVLAQESQQEEPMPPKEPIASQERTPTVFENCPEFQDFIRMATESIKTATDMAKERAAQANAQLFQLMNDPGAVLTAHSQVCHDPGCKVAAWEKAHDEALAAKLLADQATVDAAYAKLHPQPQPLTVEVR